MKIAVFGGAGFIGSHFVDKAIYSGAFTQILVVDSLTYAGNLENLKIALRDDRVKFIKSDILSNIEYEDEFTDFDVVVNFAAESHVDRSIDNPLLFAQTNSLGPSVLVNACMRQNVKRFIQVSTDEVYGPVITGESVESSPILPTSPYAASKAAGEIIAISYWRTYGYPVIVTRGCNTYGSRQYPEKLIPLAIDRLSRNMAFPQYGNGEQIREWINVEDHAEAILKIALAGEPGEIYNIGTGERISNRDLLFTIARILGADVNLIQTAKDRLGHDFRYALDSSKIASELSWSPSRTLQKSIAECSTWLEKN